jgi:hypothetical protein
MILTAMLGVAKLLVGFPMPDRLKGMTWTKRDAPGPPCWGLSLRLTTSPLKNTVFQNLMKSQRLRLNLGCNGPAAAAALFCIHIL